MRRGWAWVSLAAAALAGDMALVWWHGGEATAATLAAVMAAVLAATGPLASWLPGAPRATTSMQHQLDQLAAAVRRQWEEEAAIRQLRDPEPLTVRWTDADPSVMDWPDVIVPQAAGHQRRPTRRLSLTGRLDQLVDAFRHLPRHRLIVIGRPGAGKSVALVLLTLGLLDRQQAEDPVPVLLTLSSWNPLHEPFLEWLPRHLGDEYAFLRAGGRAQAVVAQRRVLPLLDGLDEMPAGSPAAALEAINRAGVQQPVVVACRSLEFAEAVREGDALTGAAVVELEPVEPKHVINYLRLTTPRDDRLVRWEPVFAQLRRGGSSPAAEALSTPLMVSLARTIYALDRTTDPGELVEGRRFPTRMAIEGHLLKAWIPAVFNTSGMRLGTGMRRWESYQAHWWLTALAEQMHVRSTRDLAWWDLAATVRSGSVTQPALGLTAGLLFGAPLGCGFGLAVGWRNGLLIGAVASLTWALAVVFWARAGLLRWRPNPAHVVLRPHRSFWRRARWSWLVLVLQLGLGLGLAFGLVVGLIVGPGLGLRIGLAGGLGVVVASLLIEVLSGLIIDADDAASPISTLRGDRAAVVYMLATLGLGSAVAIAIVTTLIAWLAGPATAELCLWGGIGVAMAGGTVWIGDHHWPWYQLARIRLAIKGQIPWRLMAFLEEAHRLGVLRQVGAVYQFRHARLQDCLAGVETGRS